MLPMDHFPRIIQHLSCTRLLLMPLNPSLFPLLHLLSFSHGSHHSRLSERFLCSERLLSHCGSVKWGSYLSSLNVSKRMGNQWCIPVHENFSVNLISPPTYLFVHLSLYLTLCHPYYFLAVVVGKDILGGAGVSVRQKRWPYGNFKFPLIATMVPDCPDMSVMFRIHYTEHGWPLLRLTTMLQF